MPSIFSDNFLQLSRYSPEKLTPHSLLTLSNDTQVLVKGPGIIQFNPAEAKQAKRGETQKYVILSSGIHGNETAPIEICDDFVELILRGDMQLVHPVLFIFGNLASMEIEKRFVSENLNRLFDKNLKVESSEGDRAHELMQAVDEFFADATESATKIHYDLHTAIRDSKNEKFLVYPYLYGREYDKSQLQFMSACGVNTVLLSQGPTATFSHYSSKHHSAHAFTVELGKVRRFGENDMSKFEAVRIKLTELLCNTQVELDSFESCPIEVFEVSQEVIKGQDDFVLHFDEDVANFTEFNNGDLLASESGKDYRAQQDGEAIVFPNANVTIGQRALLTVIPYEL